MPLSDITFFSIKFYQPHTFIGILTLVIYSIQWILGALFYFLQIIPLRHKISFMPIHRAIGSLSYVLGKPVFDSFDLIFSLNVRYRRPILQLCLRYKVHGHQRPKLRKKQRIQAE